MPRQWESFPCQVATTSISDSSGCLGVVNGFGSITEMGATWIITDSDGSGSPSLYDSLHEHGLYSQNAWHRMQALSLVTVETWSSYLTCLCFSFLTCKMGLIKVPSWDFPGGPVVKTPRSQCRGPGFDPWSGN